MKHSLFLFVLLSAAWLLWSGIYQPLTLTLGLVSVVLVCFISRRMGLADDEGTPLGIAVRTFLFLPWLIFEILKANVDVALRIISPRMPISPRIIRVKAGQRTDLARVIYANCITLTPGTVSVDIEGDEIVIHALSREAAAGVESGVMGRKVERLEGRV